MTDNFRTASPMVKYLGGALQVPQMDDVSEGTQMVRQHEHKLIEPMDQIEQLQWVHPEPRSYLVKAVSILGKLPDKISHQRNGCATWLQKDGPVAEFEVRDEAILYPNQVKVNFCYATSYYKVEPKCSGDIRNLYPGILYDHSTHKLTVRSYDFESCVALLMLATAVGNCVVVTDKLHRLEKVTQTMEKAHDQKFLLMFIEQLDENLINAISQPMRMERILKL